VDRRFPRPATFFAWFWTERNRKRADPLQVTEDPYGQIPFRLVQATLCRLNMQV
jgi:hypothetical protein